MAISEQELNKLKQEVSKKQKERDLFQFQCFNLENKPQVDLPLCWRVFTIDMNSDEILAMNVFDLNWEFNGRLYEITKNIKDFKEWEKELNSALHTFWSRFQYEICVTGLLENSRKVKKVDVYTQITMNWSHFTNYLWNNKNLIFDSFKEHYNSYIEYINSKRQYFKMNHKKIKRG